MRVNLVISAVLSLIFPLLCAHLSSARNVFDSSPSTPAFYSSGFSEPKPPSLKTDFKASFMQHSFDETGSRIMSGFIYVASSQQKVRADAAGNGFLQTIVFDFNNANANGTVATTTTSIQVGSAAKTSCSTAFTTPFIHAIPPDFLSQENAVYAGQVHDDLHGAVSAWTFTRDGALITFFLDGADTFVRFDFAVPAPALRLYTSTRYFNIIPGQVDPSVFKTSCK